MLFRPPVKGMTMVFVPTRGDNTLRFGPDIPNTPFQPGVVPAAWYTDPERFDLERKYVLNPNWRDIANISKSWARHERLFCRWPKRQQRLPVVPRVLFWQP